ncbi:MAG: hypothetical protein LBS75_05340 [Synergistaceae bacterium]|jgi:hypothetical protein|nr:hypothetical protein [Synergistaceae bacterium]
MNPQEALEALSKKNKDLADIWAFMKECGVSVTDVFLWGGPNSIAIYEPGANPEEAVLLLDELAQNDIAVRCVITKHFDDAGLSGERGIEAIFIEDLDPGVSLDFVVLLSNDDYIHKKMDIEKRTPAEVIPLPGLLNLILNIKMGFRLLASGTKRVNARLCSVAWPSPIDFKDPALYEMYLKRECFSSEYLIDKQFFQDMYSDIPEYSPEYMAEVSAIPPTADKGGYIAFNDYRGAYMNVADEIRFTVGQPDRCDYGIYVYGGCIAFTSGVDDRYTIASILQRYINDYYGADRGYKVFNTAYIGVQGMDDTFAVKAMEKCESDKKIMLWFMRGDLLFSKRVGGKFHEYIGKLFRKNDVDYINPTHELEEAAAHGNVYTDNTHVNHRGCGAFAKAVFTKYLKNVLDEDDRRTREEGSSEKRGTSLASKWEKLRDGGRSLGEFFKASACKSAAVRCSDMCEEEITSLVGELTESGIDVKYLISVESNGARYRNPHGVRFVKIDDLPAVEQTDVIIAMPGEEIFNIKGIFRKHTKTEVIRFEDLVNLVYDKYFLYPGLSRDIAREGANSCIVFWPRTDELDIPANRKAMPKSFPLDNVDANFTYYAIQMNDTTGFSREYLNDVFAERKLIMPDGTITQKDVKSKHVNITSGRRFTPGCPQKFDRSVFIFGGGIAFGMGADDGGTVAGALQARLNDYSSGEPGRQKFRVVNDGLCARSTTDDDIMEKGVIPRFKTSGIKNGDMAIFFMRRRYSITENDRRAFGYLSGYLRELGLDAVDLTETLALYQKTKNIYFDTRHVNHRGYGAAAFKIYFDYVKNHLQGAAAAK